MMFKGSKNVEREQHVALITNVGGQSNSYTTDDMTVFWETLPSQYLPLALWLEADRMATLRIDNGAFQSERAVVKEERRLRVDNQPFGRLSEIVYDNAFTVHPYKYTTIGSMADLDAASVFDVCDFYNTYYVPANATLAIVGDFDSAQALELFEEATLLEPDSAIGHALLASALYNLKNHKRAAEEFGAKIAKTDEVFGLERLEVERG
jgi:predicted Zn-dependent peptidase